MKTVKYSHFSASFCIPVVLFLAFTAGFFAGLRVRGLLSGSFINRVKLDTLFDN